MLQQVEKNTFSNWHHVCFFQGGEAGKMKNALLLTIPVLLCLGALPTLAQRGGGGGGRGGGPPASIPSAAAPQPMAAGQHGNGAVPTGSASNSATMNGKPTASEMVTQNTHLASKLQGLLPAGSNVQQAAAGFSNPGEFVSAVHVSHNLGIPFDQLKAEVSSGKSLGAAIHDLNPQVNAKAEAKKANQQAKEDLKASRS